ncbi:uncharacterized protein LOC134182951 [Corticium candelabrum]|uniref:uncharacterized protein LOC134182951 n=1 Tax=Corticium candelabrum TaxID=121492 RepID=UPI002E2537D5|nr:uncharacterized protein LOC134182951 [Corticium candelabrum]
MEKKVSVKHSKFKVGDRVRIVKKKITSEKGYITNWTEEVLHIVEIQNTNPVTYKVKDWNEEVIENSFYEPQLQKASQDVFRIEKVIQKKGRRALVIWKEYPDAFNSWVPIDDLTTLG